MPGFCPATNGKLDLSRLRLASDGIVPSAGFVDSVASGIQALATVLGITTENLDLAKDADASDYIIYVGDGTGTRAREPNNTLRVSYVAPADGYLFTTDPDPAGTMSHEFAHLLGLADRYYEGYEHQLMQEGIRRTIPMDRRLFQGDGDYDPLTNLMSRATGGSGALTKVQRDLILSCSDEVQFSRHVVGLFDNVQPTWTVPETMYLNNGHLYTPDPPSNDLAIAGYTLLAAAICIPKAGHAVPKNSEVRKRWNLRSRYEPALEVKITTFRKGKRYKTKRTVPNGSRIHRRMMRLIGLLAGG